MDPMSTDSPDRDNVGITLSTLAGDAYPLTVNPSDTILQVKAKAAVALGMSLKQLKLTHGEIVLGDSSSLSDLGICDGAHLCAAILEPLPKWAEGMTEAQLAQALWDAAVSGDACLTEVFIREGVPLEIHGKEPPGCHESLRQGTPLWEASVKGHEDVVCALLAAKASVNVMHPVVLGFKHATNGSALAVAAHNGHVGVVRALLSANPDLETFASYNMDHKKDLSRGQFRGPSGTPLGLAVMAGSEDSVQLMLNARADIEKGCIFQRQEPHNLSGIGTPLYAAAALGHLGILKSLIAAGADTTCAGMCTENNTTWTGECYFNPVHIRSEWRNHAQESPLAVAERFNYDTIAVALSAGSSLVGA